MRLLTLRELSQKLQSKEVFSSIMAKGYCTDSRLCQPGDVFFALKGERVDGHNYIEEAQKRRAIAAVVSKDYNKEIPGLILLAVDDPLLALQRLTKTILSENRQRMVAITGSIGKTSTKEFTKTLLATKFKVAASPGNQNSQVGLPLSILNHTTGNEEILILEMGMTAPGQLSQLLQIAPPEVSVITTIALVHSCNFDSLEDIAWAKAEIFSHPDTKLGILHHGIPAFKEICQGSSCLKVSFSTTSHADYCVEHANPNVIVDRINQNLISCKGLSLPGKHQLHNLLAAVAIAKYFHISNEEIESAIPYLSLPERRLQLVRHPAGILFLNDSYNAAELSVKSALEALPQPKNNGKKIAVLGSMLELGKFSYECHKRVAEYALNYVECLYCLGEECHAMVEVWNQAGRDIKLFHDREKLVTCLRNELKADDVVLLKGSRTKALWKILEEF